MIRPAAKPTYMQENGLFLRKMFSAMMVQRGRAAIFHIYVGCKKDSKRSKDICRARVMVAEA